MTTTDTTVSNLIINTMTQAQYNQITPSDTELYLVTDSTITSSEVTTALGYTPANVDLSNVLSSITSIPPTSLKNIDGDFHFVYYVYNTSAAGSFSFNLGQVARNNKEPLNILPEDGYSYLLYVRIEAHKKASGSICLGNVENPYTNNETSWTVRAGSVTEGGVDVNDGVIPIGTDRMLYLQNVSGTSGNFQIRGYRRIGTNS